MPSSPTPPAAAASDTSTVQKQSATVRFKLEHYHFMIEWLEDETNFSLLTGAFRATTAGKGKGKTAVGAAENATKAVVFGDMAKYINSKASVKIKNLTSDSLKGRYETHLKAFKTAFALTKSTGWGFTDLERKKGMDTLAKKQEGICSFYRRMSLFAERDNVNPAATLMLGAKSGVVAKTRSEETALEEEGEPSRLADADPSVSSVANEGAGSSNVTDEGNGAGHTANNGEGGTGPACDVAEVDGAGGNWNDDEAIPAREMGQEVTVIEDEVMDPLPIDDLLAWNPPEDDGDAPEVQPEASGSGRHSATKTKATTPATPTGRIKRRAGTPTTGIGKKARVQQTEASKGGLEGIFQQRDQLWTNFLASKTEQDAELRRQQIAVEERKNAQEERRLDQEDRRMAQEERRMEMEIVEQRRKDKQTVLLQLIAAGKTMEDAVAYMSLL